LSLSAGDRSVIGMDLSSAGTVRPITRTSALRDGYSDGEIRRLGRNGTWVSIRRGSYLPAAEAGALTAAQRHELLVRSTVIGLRQPAVVSHCSAAILLGIPLWSTPLGTVHVTRPTSARSGRTASLIVHGAAVDSSETIVIDGMQVTHAARTILDLARALPFEQAVVAADAALHRKLVTPGQLSAAFERMRGTPGSRSALRVLSFADGLSESVGESSSRVMMLHAGLPVPSLQFEVHDELGTWLGRSDYAWEDGRLLGEFDGLVKYGRLLKPGETAGDVVVKEKLREDAFRDNGARVVRWVWADLAHPAGVVHRIRRGLLAVAR